MDRSLPFWIALLLAMLVPMLLGRRRERRWFSLALLSLLPILTIQLSDVGSARTQWREDCIAFRTKPQRLRHGEELYAAGVYDPALDTVTFQLPDRAVTIGPPEFRLPEGLTSPRLWLQGLAVGALLVTLSYGLGLGISRVWPVDGTSPPTRPPQQTKPLKRRQY